MLITGSCISNNTVNLNYCDTTLGEYIERPESTPSRRNVKLAKKILYNAKPQIR